VATVCGVVLIEREAGKVARLMHDRLLRQASGWREMNDYLISICLLVFNLARLLTLLMLHVSLAFFNI